MEIFFNRMGEIKMEETKSGKQKFFDKFAEISAKIGSEVHLRSLRDAFAVIMPLFILAGIGVLINNVVFPKIASGTTLTSLQVWGNLISNGTLNIAGLMLAPAIGYCLARNKSYSNPIAAAIISLASLIMTMPVTLSVIPTGAKKAVDVTGILSFTNLGTTGMFSGIIVGLLATELFIRLSNVKHLQINLGDSIPPAVSASFNSLIPAVLTASIFALIAALLAVFGNTDLVTLITTLIQEPLRKVNTSLFGMLLIYSIGNFLFTLGIHQTVINGTLLDPVLLINMNKNTAAFAAGKHIPYILTNTFRDTFGMMGGTGSTICLLIAIFLFSKQKSGRELAKLAIAPGLFNINEPVIFGVPIVLNPILMIPFIFAPMVLATIAWFATKLGLVSEVVFTAPWTLPGPIGAFMATGGDWRAAVLNIVLILVAILIYYPFFVAYDKNELAKEQGKQIEE